MQSIILMNVINVCMVAQENKKQTSTTGEVKRKEGKN